MRFFSEIYDSWSDTQEEKYNKLNPILSKLNGRILDLGIGPGYLEKYFHLDTIGVDININHLKEAKGARVLADGNKLPFTDNCFDSLICMDTIHLLEKNDFIRVLKPGGFALITRHCNPENVKKIEKELQKKLKDLNGKTCILPGKEMEVIFFGKK